MVKKYSLPFIAWLLVLSCPAWTQTPVSPPVEAPQHPPSEILPVHDPSAPFELFDVEKAPEFPGGEAAMMQFLGENIRYPALAKESNITGRVVATFVIDKDGSVKDVQLLRDIGAGCGKEAVRVISMMPKWRPGSANGKPVKVKYTLPITFRLEDEPPATNIERVYGITEVQRLPTPPQGSIAALENELAQIIDLSKKERRKNAGRRIEILVRLAANGTVSSTRVLSEPQKGFGQKAIKLLEKNGAWTPALVSGQPVPVEFALSVPVVKKKKK